MVRILKPKQKKIKTLSIAVFFCTLALLFNANILHVHAEDSVSCTFPTAQSFMSVLTIGSNVDGTTVTKENCCELAYKKGRTAGTACNFKDVGGTGAVKGGANGTLDPKTQNMEKAASIGGIFTDAITYILTQVLALCGYLFAIAATLFAWLVDPRNISDPATGVLQKQAIRDVWFMVRDLLNMTFILLLLFSAFCTIFQIDKWHFKKVWLNILINALLVNFSFPIARFFIDISNVAFYYFVNHLFSSDSGVAISGSSILANLSSASGIGKLLAPETYAQHQIPYLIASIIFVFIFGMTLIVIAALFVVRLAALAMLIMFSPVGFVGYIFPATSGYADKWWSNLFSYSFFAPIMIFVMMVTLRMMQAIQNENMQSFYSNGAANATSDQASWIANAAFYVIPIIVLWAGIGIAKGAGIAGADVVVKNVKKGGKWMVNTPWHATGIPGGIKQTADYYGKRGVKLPFLKNRHFGSDQTESTDSWVAQNIGRVPNAYNNNMLKKMGEAAKDLNVEDMTKDQLNNIAKRGSAYERLAAIEQLAKNGDVTKEQLQKDIIGQFGEKSQIAKRILGKVKESRPELAFAHIKDEAKRENEIRGFINSDKCDVKKFGKQTLQDAEFMGAVIAEGKLDQKAIDALNTKDKRNGDVLKQTITTVADRLATQAPGDINTKNANTRNIELAHLAITGKVHSSLSDLAGGTEVQRAELFKKLNKDNSSNLSSATFGTYAKEIVENLDSGKLSEIVRNIKDKPLKQTIVREIIRQAALPGAHANTLQLKSTIDRDSFMRGLR